MNWWAIVAVTAIAVVVFVIAFFALRRAFRSAWRDAREAVSEHGAVAIVARMLDVAITALVLAIFVGCVALGVTGIGAYLRAAGLAIEVQVLVAATTIAIATLAVIAAIVAAIRYGFRNGHSWRMVAVRVLAIVLLVFVATAVRPIALVRTAVRDGFPAKPRSGVSSIIGELVPPTREMSAEELAMRTRAVRSAYRGLLVLHGADGILARIAAVRRWRPDVAAAATASGVDAVHVEAVMAVESGGNPDATSSRGARGLLQLIDATARAYGIPNPKPGSYDPRANIAAGTRYLAELIAKYHGDWDTASAAYNIGESGFDRKEEYMQKLSGDPERDGYWHTRSYLPPETQRYVPDVLAWELAMRSLDDRGEIPPPNGDHAEPFVPPRFEPWVASATAAPAVETAMSGATATPVTDVPASPTSSVYYAARTGDTLGDVVVNVLGADLARVVPLNPGLAQRTLTPGDRVFLPEDRFAFHAADGHASYRAIALQRRMSAAQLLRWNGVWSDADVAETERRGCPARGCNDDRRTPSAGTPLLVRIE